MRIKTGNNTLEIRPSVLSRNTIILELLEDGKDATKTYKITVNELLRYVENR